ncbi:hypothetical protein [Pseudomonas sp. G(2018)]|uniref:hypothetical protein n=1 Tax=Pseudomonas sp. G(2018) TaxID=2502242 RepID=UPI0010F93C14|nr:hypothetical protein [Pseudomonas sp. G(2018)]
MSNLIAELRYPLHLTLDQLTELQARLDVVAASEADPDAPIFSLLDQVRALRKHALVESQERSEAAPGFYERFIDDSN